MSYKLVKKSGMSQVQQVALLALHGYSAAFLPPEKQPFIAKTKWRELGVSSQQVRALEALDYIEVNKDWGVRLSSKGFANVMKV